MKNNPYIQCFQVFQAKFLKKSWFQLLKCENLWLFLCFLWQNVTSLWVLGHKRSSLKTLNQLQGWEISHLLSLITDMIQFLNTEPASTQNADLLNFMLNQGNVWYVCQGFFDSVISSYCSGWCFGAGRLRYVWSC